MTSILKVDTIQNTGGTAPTASALGLDVGGTVVQVVNNYGTGGSGSTSTSWTQVNAGVTITPKFDDSVLIVTFHSTCYVGTSGHVGYFSIARDGTRVGSATDNGLAQMVSRSSADYQPGSLQVAVTSSSTSSTTFKVVVKANTSGQQVFFPAGSADQWTATAIEVAS